MISYIAQYTLCMHEVFKRMTLVLLQNVIMLNYKSDHDTNNYLCRVIYSVLKVNECRGVTCRVFLVTIKQLLWLYGISDSLCSCVLISVLELI